MIPLDKKYQKELDNIATQIQAAPELAKYLDEEEEDDYQALRNTYEPVIAELHKQVADIDPLQLVAFEEYLLQDQFEGLFLPKILGFAVLRGEVNEKFKYVRPQSHYKDILLTICRSSNFDVIKKRMGQTIQTGFALSSDIWITSLINEIDNKRIRYFLQGLKDIKFRNLQERKILYYRYLKQFQNENFQSAKFPTNVSELKVEFSSLKLFLMQRIATKANNASIMPHLKAFLDNTDFKNTDEYVEMLALYGCYIEMDDAHQKHYTKVLNQARKTITDFDEQWLNKLMFFYGSKLPVNAAADKRILEALDTKIDDKLVERYQLNNTIHSMGYDAPETIEAVRVSYQQHEGVSTFNEVTRKCIFAYIREQLSDLNIENYTQFFDLFKVFPIYMDIFSNQQFNQDIKDLCMVYVKKLIKRYTDKRGRDYQDIKKFVANQFLELGFLKEKQIVEFFKTRRKKKNPA